ncbi:MAG TPA: SpoIIE family protein phosphatase [Brevefilum fermentans]|jgi:serine phosphatase RsbU (regulator of sigma subunit)/Tfp pilus assembly protein PilF|nr:SpoIIE family protein phosphatase [Brevefilum fermentans]
MKCTNCQSELPLGAHVCPSCGYPVSINIQREDLYFSRLASFAPDTLIRKVRAAPYLAKERRNVTAIMTTIANDTEIDNKIPKRERVEIFNDLLDLIAKRIYEYEGAIAKLWKNTALAFFGAPISHEDDPLRAVHTASLILKDIDSLNQKLKTAYDLVIQMKIVLNTGPILIGNIKPNLKFDFQSLNGAIECIDLAIAAEIPKSRVVLFDDTYQFIRSFVKGRKLEPVFCEDSRELLNLWQVDQIIDRRSSLHRSPISHTTSMIGRKKELDSLLELSETVLAGLGRVGLILGEPGIGKSRLILEWKRLMQSQNITAPIRWIESHSLAFGQEFAYHLLKDLLRAALEITTTTPDSRAKGMSEAVFMEDICLGDENLQLYLAHLLEFDLTEQEEVQVHLLQAQELRNKYLQSVQTLFRCLSNQQPLIIVLEDLQWADASSVDLLIDLLSLTTSSPILFCLVSRQERDSIGWNLIKAARERIGLRLTELKLENLSEDESQSFVEQLINTKEIPEIIRTAVLNKSEGNPYFIEELINMLINEGVLQKKGEKVIVSTKIDQARIPDSLQGLLTARIDRLPEDARLTLRIASVIGRYFPEKVIALVMKEHAPGVNLLTQLNILESLQILSVAEVKPALTYKFHHILMHEAAYHSIVETDRIDLHRSVGLALEDLYPEQKERLAPQLAHHFLITNDTKKAYQYLDLAGHASMDAFATAEAEVYFARAITQTTDPEQLAHLYIDLGEARAQQGNHRQAVHAWNKAIDYLERFNDPDRLARTYARSARSAWWGYTPQYSLEICLRGMKAIEGAKESPDIAYLIHETGRAYFFNDQPDKARAFSEQSLEMAQRLGAAEVQAEALATIGVLPTTSPEQAVEALEKAVKISEENDLFGSASRAYINLALVVDNLGKVRLARDYRMRAIQLGRKIGGLSEELLLYRAIARASIWLADFQDAEIRLSKSEQLIQQTETHLSESGLTQSYLKGNLLRLKGDFNQAIEIFTELISHSRQMGAEQQLIDAHRALTEAILEPYLLGDPNHSALDLDIALKMLETAQTKSADETNYSQIGSLCLKSDIYTSKKDFANARLALMEAEEAYRAHPNMSDQVRILHANARIEAGEKNYQEAIVLLTELDRMLEKMEGRWWRARVWLELGEIHLQRNDPEDVDQAQNYFRDSLAEFLSMGVNYYPDIITEKLRQVKHLSRAHAIAHRKISEEMVQAGRIQHSLIPTQSPVIDGYDINGTLLPARETSGDFYDFIKLDDGKLGIVIADVGDKGAGAALYMAMSRTLIRTYARESRMSPEHVLHELNRRILIDTEFGIFLTVVFGILDPEQGTFTYVNAGHNPPILLSQKNDQIELTELKKTGSLVGIFPENTWEEKTITIHSGDVLILYTDGITEAQNEDDEFFGIERFVKTLKDNFSPSAEDLRNCILEDVQAFTGTSPRLDDITLVVIAKHLNHS